MITPTWKKFGVSVFSDPRTLAAYFGSSLHQQELTKVKIPFPLKHDFEADVSYNPNRFNLDLPADYLATKFMVMTIATWEPGALIQVGAICTSLESTSILKIHNPLSLIREQTITAVEMYMQRPEYSLKEQVRLKKSECNAAYQSYNGNPDSEEAQAVWDTLGAAWCLSELICADMSALKDCGESKPAPSNSSWINRNSTWACRAAEQAAKWRSEIEVQETLRKDLINWVIKHT
jgi:hypothetical protein